MEIKFYSTSSIALQLFSFPPSRVVNLHFRKLGVFG